MFPLRFGHLDPRICSGLSRVAKIKVGPPSDFSNFMGLVIGRLAHDKIMGFVQKAKDAGRDQHRAGQIEMRQVARSGLMHHTTSCCSVLSTIPSGAISTPEKSAEGATEPTEPKVGKLRATEGQQNGQTEGQQNRQQKGNRMGNRRATESTNMVTSRDHIHLAPYGKLVMAVQW
ncbi:hypothetical protein EDB19DRAFT_1943248 [Suillus lakei]|nr:hypothetical protein EDB19DRAFT_1943248 [Suillus lakei]